jgi:acyl-CoA synthetase (AMP-forming)/AMP-acid ligase II
MRIELGEVEAVLREESGILEAVAIGWPITDTGVGGIVAFLGSETVDVKSLLERLKKRLPQQMMPREIRLMKDLPLNSNGKVDRKALLEILKQGS